MFLSDEAPMLETLDYTIRIGSTPTFLFFDFYLYSAYAKHYVYYNLLYIALLDILCYTLHGVAQVIVDSKMWQSLTNYDLRVRSSVV